MPVELKGSTSGSVTLAAPAVAGSNTVTLPAVTGTAVVSGQNSALTLMTSQASTSGTNIDFTGIPSWVKRITVIFAGVSTSGTSIPLVQLGSGTFQTTSYLASGSNTGSGTTGANYTTGFGISNGATGSSVMHGAMTLYNPTGDTWIASYSIGKSDSANTMSGGGNITLSGTLDRVRITTVNGTDTFDAGSINVMYE